MEINIFLPNSYQDITLLSNFEKSLGITFDSSKWYQDFSDQFDPDIAAKFHAHGAIPDLTWQPQINGSGLPLRDIANGQYDDYLTSTAKRVKVLGYSLRINLAPEMNGSWCQWGMFVNGNTNSDFIDMYRHVVSVFRAQEANNVEWVWAPNTHVYNEKYTYAQMYPGDAYVTYVGLDGYNWGASQEGSEWQSFDQVFSSSYNSLVALTSKKILISETGSSELGGDKAAWITDMANSIHTSYSQLQGITWFNENKETDWRIESSPASKRAFIAAFKPVAPVIPSKGSAGTIKAPVVSSTQKPKLDSKSTAIPQSAVSITPTANSTSSPKPLPSDPLISPVSASKTHAMRRIGSAVQVEEGIHQFSFDKSPDKQLYLAGAALLAGIAALLYRRRLS